MGPHQVHIGYTSGTHQIDRTSHHLGAPVRGASLPPSPLTCPLVLAEEEEHVQPVPVLHALQNPRHQIVCTLLQVHRHHHGVQAPTRDVLSEHGGRAGSRLSRPSRARRVALALSSKDSPLGATREEALIESY